jgi:hypothetical protein
LKHVLERLQQLEASRIHAHRFHVRQRFAALHLADEVCDTAGVVGNVSFEARSQFEDRVSRLRCQLIVILRDLHREEGNPRDHPDIRENSYGLGKVDLLQRITEQPVSGDGRHYHRIPGISACVKMSAGGAVKPQDGQPPVPLTLSAISRRNSGLPV